jgi:hypothetical protein
MTSDREHAHAQAILDAIQKKVVEEYYSGPGNSLRATSDALHSDHQGQQSGKPSTACHRHFGGQLPAGTGRALNEA